VGGVFSADQELGRARAETVELRSTATRSYSLSADDSSSEDLASRANEVQPVLAPYSQIRTVNGSLLLLTESELEEAQQQPSFVISPPATSFQLIPTGNGNRNTNDVIPTSPKDECYILNIEISKLSPVNLFRESPQNSKTSFGHSFSGPIVTKCWTMPLSWVTTLEGWVWGPKF